MNTGPFANFALMVATCDLCRKTVCVDHECYREGRDSGGLVHVLCLAAFMMTEDPTLSNEDISEAVNENSDDICFTWCENPDHAPVTECRFDILGVTEDDPTVGCSPDTEQEWWADHYHALIGGKPCECRHRTGQEAVEVHEDMRA
jgi:hypothetical protein